MNKKIIYILIIFFALILQSSVAPNFFSPMSRPDFVLMLVIAFTITDGFATFFLWMIGIGVAYDALMFSVLGIHVLVTVASGYFVSFFSRRLSVEVYGVGFFIVMLFVIFAMSAKAFALAAVSVMETGSMNFAGMTGSISGVGLVKAFVFNTVLVLFWIWIIKKIKRYFSI